MIGMWWPYSVPLTTVIAVATRLPLWNWMMLSNIHCESRILLPTCNPGYSCASSSLCFPAYSLTLLLGVANLTSPAELQTISCERSWKTTAVHSLGTVLSFRRFSLSLYYVCPVWNIGSTLSGLYLFELSDCFPLHAMFVWSSWSSELEVVISGYLFKVLHTSLIPYNTSLTLSLITDVFFLFFLKFFS